MMLNAVNLSMHECQQITLPGEVPPIPCETSSRADSESCVSTISNGNDIHGSGDFNNWKMRIILVPVACTSSK